MSSPKISCPSAVAVAPTQPTQPRASPWWLESRQEETQPGQAGDETGGHHGDDTTPLPATALHERLHRGRTLTLLLSHRLILPHTLIPTRMTPLCADA